MGYILRYILTGDHPTPTDLLLYIPAMRCRRSTSRLLHTRRKWKMCRPSPSQIYAFGFLKAIQVHDDESKHSRQLCVNTIRNWRYEARILLRLRPIDEEDMWKVVGDISRMSPIEPRNIFLAVSRILLLRNSARSVVFHSLGKRELLAARVSWTRIYCDSHRTSKPAAWPRQHRQADTNGSNAAESLIPAQRQERDPDPGAVVSSPLHVVQAGSLTISINLERQRFLEDLDSFA